MFSNHVTSLSSPYFHGELTLAENHRVSEHLLACRKCRAEFDEIKLGVRFAEQLQIISAPDSVWAGIAERLDRNDLRPVRFWFRKPLAIAASVVVILGAALILLRPGKTTPVAQWNVAR